MCVALTSSTCVCLVLILTTAAAASATVAAADEKKLCLKRTLPLEKKIIVSFEREAFFYRAPLNRGIQPAISKAV